MRVDTIKKPEEDLFRKLKWMMLFRLLFALLFLGGTIVYSAHENLPYFSRPLVYIYWLMAWIILLSLCYALVFSYFRNDIVFAYLQTGVDTMIVTVIIFLTGSYSSLFNFLYLIVIICASMLLSRRGSFIVAGLCCLEYGIMVDLEYYKVLRPVFLAPEYLRDSYEWNQVLYKMGTVMLACFLTTVLSTYLAEQERRAQSDLQSMENQVKRMEQMAVVGEMASGLAHEIKNPLASLSGSIQMLKEAGQVDREQTKLMTIALREVERLNALVSDFLKFARPKKGTPEIIHVGAIVEDMITQFETQEAYKDHIRFEAKTGEDLWTEMDPGQLKQVLLNLMLNAAESIGKKQGTIRVLAFLYRDRYVRIKIIDDGEGIDESIISSIFDPFFTTKSKGTGLGLSIVLRILQAYNYNIDVKSEKGRGSTFTLTLSSVSPPKNV